MSLTVIRSKLEGDIHGTERITIGGSPDELDLVHRVLEAGIEILVNRREYIHRSGGIGRTQEALLAPLVSNTSRPERPDTSAIFADHGKDSPL